MIHNEIINSGIKLNIILETALLNMYSKCGSMNEAHSIFDNMKSRDIITWNAMISGYGQNGDGKESASILRYFQFETFFLIIQIIFRKLEFSFSFSF